MCLCPQQNYKASNEKVLLKHWRESHSDLEIDDEDLANHGITRFQRCGCCAFIFQSLSGHNCQQAFVDDSRLELGAAVAREFGEHGGHGIHQGTITSRNFSSGVRTYTITYADGDIEELSVADTFSLILFHGKHFPGARSPEPGARSHQEPPSPTQSPNHRVQEPGARNQEPGATRSQEPPGATRSHRVQPRHQEPPSPTPPPRARVRRPAGGACPRRSSTPS